MNKNINVIFTGIFLAFSLAISVLTWYSVSTLHSTREEYDQLNGESNNNSDIIKTLEARNASLYRITALQVNNAQILPDAISFFSMLRTLLERHGINLMNMTTSGGDSDKGDNVLQVKIDGNYYEIVKMLADIRNLPAAARITNFSIKRNHDLPGELVEVDLRLEVLTED
ncbi:MAG: hypothetical protein IJQ74_07350 [Synergistaceae bacterium]|nr:hypothetical protein [Synergistaceae bacterium]MBQ7267090.1 hypothetical protein [Synergistaceae bacterium]